MEKTRRIHPSELLFHRHMTDRYPTLSVEFSDEDGDRDGHYDIWVDFPHLGKTKFDVKSYVKSSTASKKGLRWVEFTNVRGDKGWINGDADYIVFEEPDSFIIVNRLKLLKFVTKNVTDRKITKREVKINPVPYVWYTRAESDRKDKITMIPASKLRELGSVMRKKPELLKALQEEASDLQQG